MPTPESRSGRWWSRLDDPDSSALTAALVRAHREEWSAVISAAVRITRDLDLAEDCAQDAFARALATWPRDGVPTRPGAWLTTVARNRAYDLVRRDALLARTLPLLVMQEESCTMPAPGGSDEPAGPDEDRLRLVFACCHPALARSSQIALTLRLFGGLSTAEVARSFLVSEPTMAARITRAKKKIATARIPFRLPQLDELPRRVDALLDVIQLIFTAGHTAPQGSALLRGDLIESAFALARLLSRLRPADPEVTGLLGLLLLTDARRAARVTQSGELILLEDQDRALWDRAMIAEGAALVEGSLRALPSGRYGIQGAIAALHAEALTAEETDWPQIVALYDVLAERHPSPVVDLNRAVAIGFRDGFATGLDALEPLLNEPALATYGYLSAARGDFLRRLNRSSEAAEAYREAIILTSNEVELAFLQARLDEVLNSGD